MSNPFYTVSGAPVTGSSGLSAIMRAEFALIAAGFNLLPALTAGTAIVVNPGGTALTNAAVTGTGKMVMDTSPNLTGPVGIGMVPVNILDITKIQNGNSAATILNSSSGTAASAAFNASNGTATGSFGVFGVSYTTSGVFAAGRAFIQGSGGLSIYSATDIRFAVNGSSVEIGRFGTDGSLLVGTTTNGGWSGSANASIVGTNALSVYGNNAGAGTALISRIDNTAGTLAGFYYTTSLVGSVTTNGTGVTYGTASDASRKTNIVVANDSGALIDALSVRAFDWKPTAEAHKHQHVSYGFIAQEVEAVLADTMPHVISTLQLADDQSLKMIDHSALVPLLTQEIKSLRARVAALEQGKAI